MQSNMIHTKRPVLILVTQLFVGLWIAGLLFLLLTDLFKAAPFALAQGFPIWRIFLSIWFFALPLGLLVALFVGLVKRRRWTWLGSIAFALLFLALVVALRIWPPQGSPLPIFLVAPQQHFGAAIADVTITVLLVLFPICLFFSTKVRAFFNVVR